MNFQCLSLLLSLAIDRGGKKKKYKNSRTQFEGRRRRRRKKVFSKNEIDLVRIEVRNLFHRFERSYRSRETNTKSNRFRKFYVKKERKKENQIFQILKQSRVLKWVEILAQLLLLSSFRTFTVDTWKSARPRYGGRLNGEFSGSSTMQIRGARRKHGFCERILPWATLLSSDSKRTKEERH